MLNVTAQTDSIKQLTLQDVVINGDATDRPNDVLNFYRSSRTFGTEDLLSRIEGVNLIRRGAFAMEPTLRAYSAGQINLMINGMRMYGACTDKMDPISSYIEPNNLSKIQLAQGVGSSTLANSIGGTINFQLSEAQLNCHKTITGNAYTLYSSINYGSTNGFLVNVSGKKIGLRLNSTLKTADNYKDGNDNRVAHSAYNKWNIHANTLWLVHKNHQLVADVIYDRAWNVGYPALTMDVLTADAFIASISHRFSIKKWNSAEVETKWYYNNIVHLMDDTKRPETPIHMDMPGWSYTSGFYSKLNFAKQKHALEIRIDGNHTTTRADMTMYPPNEKEMYMQTLPTNELINLGGAFLYQYRWNKAYVSSLTSRWEHATQKVTSQVGIQQWEAFGFNVKNNTNQWIYNHNLTTARVDKNNRLQLSLAQGNRLPSANERLGFYLYNRGDGYDYIGNFTLKPEEVWQIELKETHSFKKLTLSITGFYHYLTNYIYAYSLPDYSAMTIGARGVKTYSNLSNATLLGAEASYIYTPFTHFIWQGNARYTYGELSNKLPMQQVPPLKWINAWKLKSEKWQLQLEHALAANQTRINPDFQERKTNWWQTVAARGSYTQKLKTGAIQFTAAVENIFNETYREHLDWGPIFQPGRNFIVGVTYFLQ